MKLVTILNSTKPIVQVSVNDTLQLADNQLVNKNYQYLRRKPNPEYLNGLINCPLRTCLIHNNSDRNFWQIKTKAKWETDLLETSYNRENGEVLGQAVYTTDDLKSGNNRKIKAVDRFTDFFNPLYKFHKVSLLFFTLTIANQSRITIAQTIDILKKRCKRNNVNLKGYLWIIEVSPEGLHVHYHLVLATDRVNLKGGIIPDYFKLDNVWGARTQVGFVKKNVKYYLSKYFKKNNYRILGKRSYGISIPKKVK
jgi:hypothetical protein